jgi:hypothetical protein
MAFSGCRPYRAAPPLISALRLDRMIAAPTRRSRTAKAGLRSRLPLAVGGLTHSISHGIPISLTGIDALIAACASDQKEAIRSLTTTEPRLRSELKIKD